MITIRSSEGEEFYSLPGFAIRAVERSMSRPYPFAGDFRGQPGHAGHCRLVSARGFVVACPDLFWRQVPGVQLTDHSDEEWQRAMELYQGLDEAKAVADATATLAFLRQHPACTGKVGTVGFCLGGKLAYLLATRSDPDCSSPFTASASSPLSRKRRALVVRRCCTWREGINSVRLKRSSRFTRARSKSAGHNPRLSGTGSCIRAVGRPALRCSGG